MFSGGDSYVNRVLLSGKRALDWDALSRAGRGNSFPAAAWADWPFFQLKKGQPGCWVGKLP